MPELKIAKIVSFSTEDKNHPASNLLRDEGSAKWKCATAGEKQCSVVLELEEASQIAQIDIGNDGSAFVEVLVSRAESAHDFRVLLVASSFMSPSEARSGTNISRVRMFNETELNKANQMQKWDRVKVVCTQPFNKTSQYGLSFVKLHSSQEGKPSTAAKQKTLGGFILKDKSEVEDTIKPGSLFANRNKPKEEPVITGAAAARIASRLADQATASTVKHTCESSRDRKEEIKNSSTSSSTSSSKEKTPKEVKRDEPRTKEKPSVKRQSSSSTKSEEPPAKKKAPSPPPKASDPKTILRGVTFVLSGYQNPFRAKLRDTAVAMGAKYKGDWEKGCTHLICAFVDTPKYRSVNGKGRIVKKDWIMDCSKQKRLLPWRKYRLGDAETPPGSDDEGDVDSDPPPARSRRDSSSPPTRTRKRSPPSYYEPGTDSEEEDTDDEIERIRAAKKAKAAPKPAPKATPKATPTPTAKPPSDTSAASMSARGGDVFDAPTDEDSTDDDESTHVPPLLNLFTNKTFLLFGKFSPNDKRTLSRYITAYNGEVSDYMSDQVNYVISEEKWDDNFDDALSENSALSFVRPQWIYDCNDKQKLLPHQKYTITPA